VHVFPVALKGVELAVPSARALQAGTAANEEDEQQSPAKTSATEATDNFIFIEFSKIKAVKITDR
jgi:hypothetical protein